MKALSDQINNVFRNCLYNPEELPSDKSCPNDAILVEGIRCTFAFHPERIKKHKEEIREFLNKMPEEFHKDTGGGWTFLNLCNDINGNQWGSQLSVEQLVTLGIAVGMASYCAPKELWSALPGGVPYIVFDTKDLVKI